MAKTSQYSYRSTAIATTAVRFSTPYQGAVSSGASEVNDTNRPIRALGIFSNMYVRVIANATTSASSAVSRVAVANGNQTLSIGIAATGEFEDTTNTDTPTTGQLLGMEVINGGGGTMTITGRGMAFTATTNTVVCYASFNYGPISPAAATQYFFRQTNSAGEKVTTETAAQQLKSRVAGTAKNSFVRMLTNATAVGPTYGNRLNGGNGAMSIAVPAGTTGTFEDTVNTNAIVVGDLFNKYTTSGDTGNIVALGGYDIETTDGTVMYVTTGIAQSYAANITRYEGISGQLAGVATESDTQTKLGVVGTSSQYEIYISANTVTAASTVTSRVGAAPGNGSISITASTTGWFEDTSHSDVLVPTSEVNWQIVTGATGTSLAAEYLAMKLDMSPTVSVFTPYLTNMWPTPAPRRPQSPPPATPMPFVDTIPGLGYSVWAGYPDRTTRRFVPQGGGMPSYPIQPPTPPVTTGVNEDTIHLGTKESLGVTSQPTIGGWQAW